MSIKHGAIATRFTLCHPVCVCVLFCMCNYLGLCACERIFYLCGVCVCVVSMWCVCVWCVCVCESLGPSLLTTQSDSPNSVIHLFSPANLSMFNQYWCHWPFPAFWNLPSRTPVQEHGLHRCQTLSLSVSLSLILNYFISFSPPPASTAVCLQLA